MRDQDGAKYWAGQVMGMHFSVRNFGSPLEVGRFLKLIGLGGGAVFHGVDVPSRFQMHSALLSCVLSCAQLSSVLILSTLLPLLFERLVCKQSKNMISNVLF